MEKLEILKEQYAAVADKCREDNASLYKNKCNLEHYNQVISIKDASGRFEKYIAKAAIESLLLFLLFLIFSNFGMSIFQTTFNMLLASGITTFSIQGIVEVIVLKKDLKKYKKIANRYSDYLLDELVLKANQVEENIKELEIEIKEQTSILRFLNTEIEKTKIEIEEEKTQLSNKIKDLVDEKYITYKNVHLNDYDIPKVKIKRRDENVTKAKGNI